jgi:hypothetical protein
MSPNDNVTSSIFRLHKCRVHSIFRFLVKVTKKRKTKLSFSGKMQIFHTENKRTDEKWYELDTSHILGLKFDLNKTTTTTR